MRKMFVVLSVVSLTFGSCKKAELAERGVAPPVSQGRLSVADTAVASSQGAPAPAGSTASSTSRAMSPSKPAPSPRMIVRTATLSLIVTDAAEAMRALSRQAAQLGGYVTESKQWRENDQLRGSVTMRVPSERFDDMTATVKKSAVRVQSESVSGEDVTQEFSDLGARLRNAEAAEIELRELLTSVRQRTQKAADVLEVYEKLHELRGEIEQIKGRMQYLGQVTAMSTLTVELIPDVLAQPVVEPGWRPSAIARRAVRALVASLQWLAEAAIWLSIYLLPVAFILALFVFVVWRIGSWLVRAMRKPA
ncbi:MAG: DUF4349 domain-containing protein [Acidobacteriota bacterium]